MQRFFFFLFLIILAVTVGYYTDADSIQKRSIGVFNDFKTGLTPEPILEETVEFSTIRFVGDVLLARRVETLMNTYGSDYPYTSLLKTPSTTLLFGNFEASIPEKHIHTPDLTFSFSVNKKHLDALRSYGFTHLNLANNHSYDFGEDAFSETREALHTFETFGIPEVLSENSVVYTQIGTTTIAVVGMSAIEAGYSFEELSVYFKNVVAKSNFQVVYIHWGSEYKLVHNSFQENLAHALIDVGVDAIIGHHPHVVQDIGLYKDVPIFYSLGNFIFDQYFSEDVQTGLILDLKVKSNQLVFELVPVTSIGSQSVPRVMSEFEKEIFLTKIAKLSASNLKDGVENGYIGPRE